MTRAIEIDENGKTVLTNGIAIDLPPGRLSLANLKAGDVLVWYSASPSRKISAIREFSEGPFSHVGIYTENGCSIDAGPGVVEETPVVVHDGSYVQVMRKKKLTSKQQAKVVAAGRKFLGYRYAWLDAIALPLRRRAYYRRWNPLRSKWDWITGRAWLALLGSCLIWLRLRFPPSKKIFCSQIIIEAYAAIGYFPEGLVESGIFTPNDLAVDSSFTYSGWLAPTTNSIWHPLDPYSPDPVDERQWRFNLARIFR